VKTRIKIPLAGALLIVLAAWSSMKRGVSSDSAGRNGGACCTFMRTLGGMPLSPGTNGLLSNGNTNTPSAANRLQ
jgi:hypothetical protein